MGWDIILTVARIDQSLLNWYGHHLVSTLSSLITLLSVIIAELSQTIIFISEM